MKNRRFLTYLFLSLSVTAFGCAKLSLSADAPSANTIVVISPTPPPSVNLEEPPPPEPLSPKPESSLSPKLSESDVALIEAVKSENIEDVKRLLTGGANPNSFFKDANSALNYYETVLGLAIDKKNVGIANLLLEYRADVNKHSFDAHQPPILSKNTFGVAVYTENVEMIELLADYNADTDFDDKTVVYSVKTPEVLNLLVKNGYDVNARTVEGETILTDAIFAKDLALVKAILKYNPDLNQKTGELVFTDYKKLTLLQLAERYGSKEIIRELKKAGARK